MKKLIICLSLSASGLSLATAQDLTPQIGGTIRSKYEYQTGEGEGRFEVRTARVNVTGALTDRVTYKAEIDLCDEGSIKMLDAYTKIRLAKDLAFTVGQERVPFTIDAHRSPHQQYFANRSFIAKQVGNVRDVGAELSYTLRTGFPIMLRFGVFNGSGLTNQKDFWTSSINFSGKAEFMLPVGMNVVLGVQRVKPDATTIMMYDAGANWRRGGFFVEAEYLFKHYAGNAYDGVHAVDAFACYDIPTTKKAVIRKVSPLLRYDFMTDHSDGMRYLDGEENAEGTLTTNDYRRSRLTGGVTLSLGKPFLADIRLNCEKYFYDRDGLAKTSEKDKIVVEFMVHF